MGAGKEWGRGVRGCCAVCGSVSGARIRPHVSRPPRVCSSVIQISGLLAYPVAGPCPRGVEAYHHPPSCADPSLSTVNENRGLAPRLISLNRRRTSGPESGSLPRVNLSKWSLSSALNACGSSAVPSIARFPGPAMERYELLRRRANLLLSVSAAMLTCETKRGWMGSSFAAEGNETFDEG